MTRREGLACLSTPAPAAEVRELRTLPWYTNCTHAYGCW